MSLPSGRLEDAALAFAGLYSPFAIPLSSTKAKSFPSAPKTTAEQCLNLASRSECPSICTKKRVPGRGYRCLPPAELSATTPQLNNSMTFDLYKETGRLTGSSEDTYVPLLYSEDSGTIVVPFPVGDIRKRGDVLSVSARYKASLKEALGQAPDFQSLVICGHSSGGVDAEALALLIAGDDDMKDILAKTYLVSSGSHLWMTENERDIVVDKFAGRFVSFAGADKLGYVGYDRYNVLWAYPEDEGTPYKWSDVPPYELVSLPKLLLVENGDVDCILYDIDLFKTQMDIFMIDDIRFGRHPGDYTHPWEYHENLLRIAFTKENILRGGSVHGRWTIWAACAATIVLSSLFPR
jgi:hypothetical protein